MRPNIPLRAALALVGALMSCSGQAPPGLNPVSASLDNLNAVDSADFGFTPGWFDGQTVQFFYHKPFFCQTPVEDGLPVGSTSGCEVGSDGTVDPRPGNIPILFVVTPIGFRPAEDTLHCPVVGNCINHPHTLDVSRVFGPGTENVPLPAHSHVVAQASGNWWELHVVGVKDPATWDKIVAGKSLATLRALQAADPAGDKITAEILTNTYLFFDVQAGM